MAEPRASGGSGLAGLVVTALVAALVAFGVTALLGRPAPEPGPPATGPSPAKAMEALRDEVAGLRAEVRRAKAPAESAAAPPAPAADPGAPPGPALPGPAGPLPATRAELVTLIDARIAEKAPSIPVHVPRKKVTLEEAGEEMGLTSVEIDAARRAYREAETELISCLMGTADLEAVKEEAAAAKEDPDRKAALVQKVVGNGIRNLGRILTIEDRRDRELKRFLTPEQVKKLKGYDLKSIVGGEELEGLFDDAGR